jgi:hypothetical protein
MSRAERDEAALEKLVPLLRGQVERKVGELREAEAALARLRGVDRTHYAMVVVVEAANETEAHDYLGENWWERVKFLGEPWTVTPSEYEAEPAFSTDEALDQHPGR